MDTCDRMSNHLSTVFLKTCFNAKAKALNKHNIPVISPDKLTLDIKWSWKSRLRAGSREFQIYPKDRLYLGGDGSVSCLLDRYRCLEKHLIWAPNDWRCLNSGTVEK